MNGHELGQRDRREWVKHIDPEEREKIMIALDAVCADHGHQSVGYLKKELAKKEEGVTKFLHSAIQRAVEKGVDDISAIGTYERGVAAKADRLLNFLLAYAQDDGQSLNDLYLEIKESDPERKSKNQKE